MSCAFYMTMLTSEQYFLKGFNMRLFSEEDIKKLAEIVISYKSSEYSYTHFNELRIKIRNYLDESGATIQQMIDFDTKTKSAPIQGGHWLSYD